MKSSSYQKELQDKFNLVYPLSAVHPALATASPNRLILESHSPIDGALLGTTQIATKEDYEKVILRAQNIFPKWSALPAPKRGEIIREIANALRVHKQMLGRVITLEVGKILAEGEGEVQEAIDIADYASGLSRQLSGFTIQSERPSHRMFEQWHPLGIVGVITAFNFPMAVWAWNAMIAAVCGDVVIWKCSELAPLCAVTIHKICQSVLERHGFQDIFQLIIGNGPELGVGMAEDKRIPLISATGSTRMGRDVATRVGARLGRTLLELGGNNAMIVLADADQKLALRSVLFGALGTAGQRCTSTRRLLVHKSIKKRFLRHLLRVYPQVRIGNPLNPKTLVGPLIDERAVNNYLLALERISAEGGKILCGGKRISNSVGPFFVEPTIIEAHRDMPIISEETFAPILYVLEIKNIEDAINLNNSVPQGLSSVIFTNDLRSSETYLSQFGSDCGIANVNAATSGAEIGGAFGGEKDTGGGREAGGESWKQYMRRQTCTINHAFQLPLAQGIKFGDE